MPKGIFDLTQYMFSLHTTPSRFPSKGNNTFQSLFDIGDSFFKEFTENLNKDTQHPYNMYADFVNLIIEVPLAGYKKNNINITVDPSNYLHIHVDKNNYEMNYIHKGISRKEIKLRFALSKDLDIENIRSTYVDGLLTVIIPIKSPEPVKPAKKIPVL